MSRPPLPAALASCAILLASPPAPAQIATAQNAPSEGAPPQAAPAPRAAVQPPPRPLRIVAAENFYADVARQLAGDRADVTAVLDSPDQDPHLFEPGPSVARAVAGADIVIANGAGYDSWMAALLSASPDPRRQSISVASLVDRRLADNPHLWYDPATMPALARALAEDLVRADPAGEAATRARLAQFIASLAPLDARIAGLRARHAGTPVTATEPVFGDMARALGLGMRNQRFQLAVMNDTEPSASDVAGFEDDLRQHRVALLVTNSQSTDSAAGRLAALARQAGIPVLAVTETEPPGLTYQAWMLGQLDALDRALSAPRPASR